jgi:molecular chaperone DnaK
MSVDLSREDFDRLTASLLLRTRVTTELVLESAGLTWLDIDRILLVGGMTRVPHVREMLRKISGREPDCSLAADEVVAHGAAIHGGMLLARQAGLGHSEMIDAWSRFETVDVNSHSLGIAVRTPQGYANSILIPKNTQLPFSRSKTYHTSAPNQRQVRVRVLEGEAREADACVQIGEFILQGLPENLPERSPIEVECRYGADGRISVVGREPVSGCLAEATIERHGQLLDAELETERDRLEGWEVV